MLNSGTNRFYGLQATVRKFLFFTKKYRAVCEESNGSPKEALEELFKQIPEADKKRATYQAFIQTVEVFGWKDGKPICNFHEPTWWKVWDYATLMEKAKGW